MNPAVNKSAAHTFRAPGCPGGRSSSSRSLPASACGVNGKGQEQRVSKGSDSAVEERIVGLLAQDEDPELRAPGQQRGGQGGTRPRDRAGVEDRT